MGWARHCPGLVRGAEAVGMSATRIGRTANRALATLLSPVVRRVRPTVPSTKDWIAEKTDSNYSYRVIHEGGTFHRLPPCTISSEVHAAFAKRLTYELPEVFVARLPGARLVGTNGLVVVPGGGYLVESSWERYWLVRDNAYASVLLPRRVRHSGAYASIITTWWENSYFHWICDVLPRLYGIETLPETTRVIVPDRMTPFQRDLLELAGVKADRLVPFGGGHWELEDFYFCSVVGRTGNMAGWALCWLRDRLMQGVDTAGSTGKKRLYISRALAASRRVVNEDEVMELLEARGFERVFPERLTARQQVELFSTAEIVVAPHGAGNTNMLFAPPGAQLVELQVPGLVHVCYWSLCDALGHGYWYLMCEPQAGNRRGADMTVPMDGLRRILGCTLAAPVVAT